MHQPSALPSHWPHFFVKCSKHCWKGTQWIIEADIWGIGRRLAARLYAAGIQTALDLKQADMAWVRRELGVVGERIAREFNGISCLTLEEAPDPQKGIATARSFGQPIEAIEGLEQALATG